MRLGQRAIKRHADAAFVQVPLHPAQRAVGIKSLDILPAFVVRAVVAGEQYQRVIVDAELLQRVDQSPDTFIHARDHRGLPFIGIGPRPIGVVAVIGHFLAIAQCAASFIVGMRNRHRPKQKERPLSICAHKVDRLACDQIMTVFNFLRRIATGRVWLRVVGYYILQRDSLRIAPQKIGIVVVGVRLVEIAVEVVEALIVGQALVAALRIAQPPFAAQRRRVAGLLEHFGNRHILRAQGRNGSRPVPAHRAWPVCKPVISTHRDGAHTVDPA